MPQPFGSFVRSALLTLAVISPVLAAETTPLVGAGRVLFLGDSITHSGRYIADVETYLRLRYPAFDAEFLSLGLSRETCSGLSEPGHAGGKFPRPDVHERLARVLEATKPNLVVACYGMNCGIYHPLSDERFAAYRAGREKLHQAAVAAGAKVLHLTPPVFDPHPIRARTLPAGKTDYAQPYVGYNDVLDAYAAWLVSKRADGWEVCDVHTPMNRATAAGRAADPNFTLAPDGVHPNDQGHWEMARALLEHWGVPAGELQEAATPADAWRRRPQAAELHKLLYQRQQLLHDAWLTKTGHKRPGVKPGLPLDEAQTKANELNAKIEALQKAGD